MFSTSSCLYVQRNTSARLTTTVYTHCSVGVVFRLFKKKNQQQQQLDVVPYLSALQHTSKRKLHREISSRNWLSSILWKYISISKILRRQGNVIRIKPASLFWNCFHNGAWSPPKRPVVLTPVLVQGKIYSQNESVHQKLTAKRTQSYTCVCWLRNTSVRGSRPYQGWRIRFSLIKSKLQG